MDKSKLSKNNNKVSKTNIGEQYSKRDRLEKESDYASQNKSRRSSISKNNSKEKVNEKEKESSKGHQMLGPYQIIRVIGQGSFGKVYLGKHKTKGDFVAIKSERLFQTSREIEKKILNSFIHKEYEFYNSISKLGFEGIPKIISFCRGEKKLITNVDNLPDKIKEAVKDMMEKDDRPDTKYYTFHQYLIMELVGPNLNMMFDYLGGFKQSDIKKWAPQMINIIHFVHKQGYVHRDIKLENFAFKLPPNDKLTYKEDPLDKKNYKCILDYNKIILFDFGLIKSWDDELKKYYRPSKSNPSGSIAGTARYMSINVHGQKPYGKRDDLESLGYMLIFMIKKELPWQGIRKKWEDKHNKKMKKSDHMEAIQKCKIKAKDTLCDDIPKPFAKFMSYCWNLRITDKPEYDKLADLFKD